MFDIDEMSSHPALLAVKAKQVVASRKTVVYYTPEGVVRAIEPKSVKEALASLQCDQWLNAIHLELQNLRDHGAYHLVPASEALSQGKKILRMTFVFKVKLNDDSSLSKFKARLCVVGSSMEQGSDYWESYAACARTTSVKLVLITTTVAGWVDFHFDLYGAFLSAEIDTDVYTYQPHGVPSEEGPNGEQMVWKLDKAIYGTVQAARLFTQKFRNALLAMGFESSMDDENVYRLDHELGQIILSTHIDDGIGGASTQAVLDWFYERVKAAGFSFSAPPGPWETVLGFGVVRGAFGCRRCRCCCCCCFFCFDAGDFDFATRPARTASAALGFRIVSASAAFFSSDFLDDASDGGGFLDADAGRFFGRPGISFFALEGRLFFFFF